MPRPKKCRRVVFVPDNQVFYPLLQSAEEIVLSIEEVEAMRLSDLEAKDQDACAESMQISRGTFQRIINAARQKVADALVNGKTIRIEGGNFEVSGHQGNCHGRCGRFHGGRG